MFVVWPPNVAVNIEINIYPPFLLPDPSNIQIVISGPDEKVISGSINAVLDTKVNVTDTLTDQLFHGQSVGGYYNINITGALAPVVIAYQSGGVKYQASTPLKVGDIVRPTLFSGWVYHVVSPGLSSNVEPQWWVPFNGDNTGLIGTATAKAIPYAQPQCHGPINVDRK